MTAGADPIWPPVPQPTRDLGPGGRWEVREAGHLRVARLTDGGLRCQGDRPRRCYGRIAAVRELTATSAHRDSEVTTRRTGYCREHLASTWEAWIDGKHVMRWAAVWDD